MIQGIMVLLFASFSWATVDLSHVPQINETPQERDNASYDSFYRSQIDELLTKYGDIDVIWFDHVGGKDWSKWKFDELFSMMYLRAPNLIVNNRAAKFCGPQTPEDQGPATPEIKTDGDFYTLTVIELTLDQELSPGTMIGTTQP